MNSVFFAAVGLVFIFEGLLPFLAPHFWRRMIHQVIMQEDKTVRIFGLVSMLIGVAILYLFR